ncbi:hypothetical protein LJR164_001826 [Phenylobacterium sp. LjRoot164]|uniref:hypothetical protein n=1 Tax=unclassified Phenylobacterium TaxID=2640670 RepID=UPI003ECEDCBC
MLTLSGSAEKQTSRAAAKGQFSRMAKLRWIVVAAFTTACAHEATRPIEAPTSAEVGDHVASQWDADFSQRFSRFAGRQGQPSQLISVRNVHCDRSWGGRIANCTYDVTAVFNAEESVTRRLVSEFERTEGGSLNEVIIMWHERKR